MCKCTAVTLRAQPPIDDTLICTNLLSLTSTQDFSIRRPSTAYMGPVESTRVPSGGLSLLFRRVWFHFCMWFLRPHLGLSLAFSEISVTSLDPCVSVVVQVCRDSVY